MTLWGLDIDLDGRLASRMRASKRACVLNEAEQPFTIIAANDKWSSLCGFPGEEAIGKSPKILQGDLTNSEKASAFSREASGPMGCAKASVVNYRKNGEAFVHKLESERVYDGETGKYYFITESEEVADPAIKKAMLPVKESRQDEVSFVTALALLIFSIALMLSASFIACSGLSETTTPKPDVTDVSMRPRFQSARTRLMCPELFFPNSFPETYAFELLG